MLPFIFILALAFASCLASASTVALSLPAGGKYSVWTSTNPGPAPADAKAVAGGSVQVDVPSGNSLYVLDTGNGNLAQVSGAKLKPTLTLTAADFTKIGEVQVMVQQGGQMVAAANVALKDPTTTQQDLLTPDRKGVVSFYDVAPGDVTVSVKYVSKGKDMPPLRQLFTLKEDRSDAIPTLAVAISDPVETVGSSTTSTGETSASATSTPSAQAATSAGSPATAPAKKQPLTPIGILVKVVTMLVGLLVGIGLIYGLYRLVTSKTDLVGDQLKKFGVKIPDDQQGGIFPAQPTIPDPTPAPPAPPEKILLGDGAAPTPLAAAPMAYAAPVATGIPTLVKETGERLVLKDGSSVLGRDAAVDLPFPAETTLSRRHVEFTKVGNQVMVKDLGSTNGTYVNGSKILGDTELKTGDTVQAGSVRFRIEL